MDNASIYTKPPHAYYALSVLPDANPHVTKAVMEVSFIVCAPWDSPQHEVHMEDILKARRSNPGKQFIQIQDEVHEPDMGMMDTRHIYCEPQLFHGGKGFWNSLPSKAVLQNKLGMPHVEYVRFNRPTEKYLMAAERKHHCVAVIDQQSIWSLVDYRSEPNLPPLTVSHVQLIKPGTIAKPQESVLTIPGHRRHDALEKKFAAMDTMLGPITVAYFVTESKDIFRMACADFRDSGSHGPSQLFLNDHKRGILSERPTRDKAEELKRLHGYFTANNKKVLN